MPYDMAPPPVPPGMDKHHVVVLEGIHCPIPTFDFPHTIDIHPTSQANDEEIVSKIRNASIVVACVVPVLPRHFEQAPNARAMSVMATGIGWVDKEYCRKNNITVLNCPQSNVEAVGEHFLALYFGSRKKIVDIHNTVTGSLEWVEKRTMTKKWHLGPPISASQETLGIVGYGALGKRIEELMTVIGTKKVLVADRRDVSGDAVREGRVDLERVWKESTVLVLCCPKDKDTENLVGEKELKMMRKDCVLVNMARGGIVNEADLAKALREKWIAAAATDVLETEPNGVGGSPLLPDKLKGEHEVPNLIVSTHVAWFSEKTIENLQRLLKTGVEGWVNGRCDEESVKACVVVHDGKIWK